MGERDQQSDALTARVEKVRRDYATPSLTEYGSVAKLTQSGGSTNPEGSIAAKMVMCL